MTRQKILYILLVVLFLGYFFFVLIKSLYHVWHAINKDVINIVIYGDETILYSVGKSDSVNYIIPFYSDLKFNIPGGYGYYRIGALGKLVEFEKDQSIIKKAFSYSTSNFINYYFIPPSDDQISYGKQISEEINLPSFRQIFTYKSNASIIDRLYIFYAFSNYVNKKNSTYIDNFKVSYDEKYPILRQRDFLKSFQGLWYNEKYREEKKNVQIHYAASYQTAVGISNILEGNGIKISDIAYKDSSSKTNKCLIIEQGSSFSLTAKDLAYYFNCSLKKGDADIYDIIFVLNNLEVDWELR